MIYFTSKAYQKIKFYALSTDGEISGLGKSRFIDEKTILITDVIILEQTNTGSTTELSEEAMAKFMNEKMRNEEDIECWNVWWHSHSDFDVFWSLTDEDTIKNTTGGPYLISIVINKEMKMLGRLDIFHPIKLLCSLKISKSKGRPKKIKQYLEKICQRQMHKCVDNQIDFYDNQIYSIPIKSKNLLRL